MKFMDQEAEKRKDIRQCPKCGLGTKVINTRVDKEGHIRRRRKCLECDYRYNSVERMEEADEGDGRI